MVPFASDPRQTVAALGEARLLECIRGWIKDVSPPAPEGFGDDAAVLSLASGRILATVDGLLFGRHFEASAAPEAAGHKLLHRNLSDIAAMGGRPRAGVLALTFGPDLAMAWLERFYHGLSKSFAEADVTLAGGDLAEAGRGTFAAHLTLLGDAPPRPLTRLGSKIGDVICLTGPLGGSSLGHHLSFCARLEEGAWLAAQPSVRAMIDVTDGLAKDLPALLVKGQAAALDLAALPVSTAARQLSQATGRHPSDHALTDGEDYELLFTLDGSVDADEFGLAYRQRFGNLPHRIGGIVAAAGNHPLVDADTGAPLAIDRGYEHWVRP